MLTTLVVSISLFLFLNILLLWMTTKVRPWVTSLHKIIAVSFAVRHPRKQLALRLPASFFKMTDEDRVQSNSRFISEFSSQSNQTRWEFKIPFT